MKKKIYIAGPYTKGDVAINVKKAMDAANDIIEMGHYPFCPHLTHFLHMNNDQHYEKWLEIDAAFVRNCDAVLRIEGESNGADEEVKLARSLGIPIFKSISEISISQIHLSKVDRYLGGIEISDYNKKKVLIVGAPGTGKTSVLNELSHEGKIKVFEEVPRKVINRFKDTDPSRMPWNPPRLNFDRTIFPFYKKDFFEDDQHEYHLLDGGIPDIIAWDIFLGENVLNEALLHVITNQGYNRNVFITKPDPKIYEENDDRPWKYDEVVLIDDCLRKVYTKLGYSLLDLPSTETSSKKESLQNRVQFILDNL